MSYGIKIWGVGGEATGPVFLDINDKTVRFIQTVTNVTVPTGTAQTVSITTAATPTNSIVTTDSGAAVSVTASGVATVQPSDSSTTTTLRVQVIDL